MDSFSSLFFPCLGGVREALFGDHHYHLIWKERKGFAKVAIQAKTVRKKIFIQIHSIEIDFSFTRQSYRCLQKIVEKQFEPWHWDAVSDFYSKFFFFNRISCFFRIF